MSKLVFRLESSQSQFKAECLLAAARQGREMPVSNWEEIVALVELLDASGEEVAFYRIDPKNERRQADCRVDYTIEEMRACVKHGIEPRPYPNEELPMTDLERKQVQAEMIASLEAGVRGKEGIYPDWVYEARNAIRHQKENLPWLPDLLAALGWQSGTIHDALNCVRRLVADNKRR